MRMDIEIIRTSERQQRRDLDLDLQYRVDEKLRFSCVL